MSLWLFLFVVVTSGFVQTVHPMIITISVIISVLLVIIFLGGFFSSFWLRYVILLVFLGGLLVLFVYISSLSGNEPVFKYSWNGVVIFGFILLLISFPFEMRVDGNYFNELDTFYCLIMAYFSNNVKFVVFLLVYLVFLLLVVTDLTKFMFGPLRIIFEKKDIIKYNKFFFD